LDITHPSIRSTYFASHSRHAVSHSPLHPRRGVSGSSCSHPGPTILRTTERTSRVRAYWGGRTCKGRCEASSGCEGGVPICLGRILPVRGWRPIANWLHTDGCRYAFPNDELRPVNNSYANSRNGWGASAADALSTAIIMEIPSIVKTVVNYIPSIDWSVSYEDMPVSLFETTIRYLGGLLSGYDLLTGPFSHLVGGKAARNVPVLLDQAINLANNLSYAFDTPTGIPHNNLYFFNRSDDGITTNGLATIGTLVLEWTRLSDLSGNETYGQLAQRGESYLLHPRPVCKGMLHQNHARADT
jgi:hypothetical protein